MAAAGFRVFFSALEWRPIGLGILEILLVLAFLILLFGAKKIPLIARGLGEGIRNFRHSVHEGEEGDADGTRLGGDSGEDRHLNNGRDP